MQDAHWGAISRKGRKQEWVEEEVAKASANLLRNLPVTAVLVPCFVPELLTSGTGCGWLHAERQDGVVSGRLLFAAEADPEGAGPGGIVLPAPPACPGKSLHK